jgi:hypothetical protein
LHDGLEDLNNLSATNFSGKQWAKFVPPKQDRLMAYVDAAFVLMIRFIAKRAGTERRTSQRAE